jgi:hypothetical protein
MNEIKELSATQINAVNGGVVFLIPPAVGVGLKVAGFVGGFIGGVGAGYFAGGRAIEAFQTIKKLY